jgi:hypothetical protein
LLEPTLHRICPLTGISRLDFDRYNSGGAAIAH